MVNNILVLLWLASIVCIFYFWKRKPNRKYKRISIAVCIVLLFSIGSLPENKAQTNSNKATEVSNVSSSSSSKKVGSKDHSSSTSKKASESSRKKTTKHKEVKSNKIQNYFLKRKAEKLKLGTSMSQV